MAAIMYESYYGVGSLGSDYLMHHGIKGQKWGIRRFQNPDGTLTPEGMKRYNTDRYGKPGKSKLNRYNAKMYKKYHLFEPNPSKDQAWDNARVMADQGVGKREVSKYLKNNDLSADKFYKDHYWYTNEFSKEAKKLTKLRDQANVDLQKQNAEKYGKRAEKAKHVMQYAAGGVIGSYLSKYPLGAMTRKLMSDKKALSVAFEKRADANYNAAYKAVEQIINKPKWYETPGNHERLDRIQEQANRSFDRRAEDYAKAKLPLEKRRNNLIKAYNLRDITGKVSMAALGISSGIYAYNKIQQKRAEGRMTDEGHAKAVVAYKAQAEKIKKLRGSMRISELMKAG